MIGYHIWIAKLVWLKVIVIFGVAGVSAEGVVSLAKCIAIHQSNGKWSFTGILKVCVYCVVHVQM